MGQPIRIWGDHGVQGVYLLELALSQPLELAFGRFQSGRRFALPIGHYLYVGSALGQRGATTLAGRLLRHATRSGEQSAHVMRPLLHQTLQQVGLAATPPQQKRCHWHIDYLLDQPLVELVHIAALRTALPLEASLAAQVLADPATMPVAPGLGASDHPAATHLFRLVGEKSAHTPWRRRVVAYFANLLTQQTAGQAS